MRRFDRNEYRKNASSRRCTCGVGTGREEQLAPASHSETTVDSPDVEVEGGRPRPAGFCSAVSQAAPQSTPSARVRERRSFAQECGAATSGRTLIFTYFGLPTLSIWLLLVSAFPCQGDAALGCSARPYERLLLACLPRVNCWSARSNKSFCDPARRRPHNIYSMGEPETHEETWNSPNQ